MSEETQGAPAGASTELQDTPVTLIPSGEWQDFHEVTSPSGHRVLHRLTPARTVFGDEQPKIPVTPRPDILLDELPRTMERPGTGNPDARPAEPEPAHAEGHDDPDDVDGELKRHREWQKHRFDKQKPDPTKPGTYQKLRDEEEETEARIRALKAERRNSLWRWWWDLWNGDELRILLAHLRALRWRIEVFEEAYANGDDPVEALNRYDREEWEKFLQALYDHIQIMGSAIEGIDAIRNFQRAVNEAIEASQAVRKRKAGEWLRRRERQRALIHKPEGGGPRGSPKEHVGGLRRIDWRRIRMRKAPDAYPTGDPRRDQLQGEYNREFPGGEENQAEYGETFGTVTISEDGKTATVVTWQVATDGVVIDPATDTLMDGSVTSATVTMIPVSALPEDLGIGPGESASFAYTNMEPH